MSEQVTQRFYTVCFLFTKDHSMVLLCRKNKTDFAGQLNGVGGKLEPGETPMECARREILEETGIADAPRLQWVGTLQLPLDCDIHCESHDPMKPGCTLYFYAGEIPDGITVRELTDRKEPLFLCDVSAVLDQPWNSTQIAGGGDVQYFIGEGRAALERE